MKKFLIALAFIVWFTPSSRADLIFSENMGTPASTTLITAYTGWQNQGLLTFSGTGDVRTSTPSNYVGASGSGNVFLTNQVGRFFQISGINTSSFIPGTFDLSFGAHKSTVASSMSELLLSYSTDGINYNPISFPAQPTGTGTAVWRMISLTDINLASTSNLRLRWLNNSTTPQFRIDDVSLFADPISVPEPSSLMVVSLVGLALAGRFRRRR
jgi:PEP-CTERM motif